jgi:hypothetical protein
MKRSVMCFIAVLAITLVPQVCGAAGQGPTTWLDRPLDGTTFPFPLTSPIIIQAHASDADGVATLEFFVEDVSLGTAAGGGNRLGEATVEWTPAAAGTYTIRARAIDVPGNAGSEASSTVIVGVSAVPSPTPTVPLEAPSVRLPDEIEMIFTADRTSLQSGECAVLEWSVQGAETVLWRVDEIEPPPDPEQVDHSARRQVCPRETTTYSLAAYAGSGPPEPPTATRQLAIVVRELPKVVPPPDEVQIRFDADRTSLQLGQCATLEWSVEGGFGVELNGQRVERSGTKQVCPEETTVYRLDVGAGEAIERREVTIAVSGAAGPPEEEPVEVSVSIEVVPDAIAPGGCATLIWEVTPAGNWTMLLDGQLVSATGEQEVCPARTKTYELLVGAPGGGIVRNASVHVVEPEKEPPAPVAPGPQEPSPPQGGADTQPTDLFPQKGTIWTRITNNGHDTLSNDKVEVTISGCGAGKQYALNIAPGQTQTIDTGCQATTGSHSYTVSVIAIDFTDPNGANNTYSETLVWEGGAPPPPPPSGITPPSGPSQPTAADLAITARFPQTLHGPVYGRITNRGPAGVSNLTIQFSCQWSETDPIEGIKKTNQIGPRNITITSLSPGQTTEFNTYISVETQQYQYDMTCTIQPPSSDPNGANNSYSETF